MGFEESFLVSTQFTIQKPARTPSWDPVRTSAGILIDRPGEGNAKVLGQLCKAIVSFRIFPKIPGQPRFLLCRSLSHANLQKILSLVAHALLDQIPLGDQEVRPENYRDNIRPDGTASYFEINPERPKVSSRERGWDGIDVERQLFLPFDTGDVVYDEHMVAIIKSPEIHVIHATDGRKHEGVYSEGEMVLSPAGQPVHWRLDDQTNSLLLPIRPSLLRRVALETLDLDPAKVQLLARPQLRDPLIHQIAHLLLAEIEAGGSGERLFVESCSNILSLHLLRNYSTLSHHTRAERPLKRGLPPRRLRRAIEAIQDRVAEGVSLAEIAEAAGVSPSHFSTLFRRSTGLSPHQFLIHCRVERAKELLQAGDEDLSLAQIATTVGFFDQSHLNRHFKRLVGVTPARFRKMS